MTGFHLRQQSHTCNYLENKAVTQNYVNNTVANSGITVSNQTSIKTKTKKKDIKK